MAEHPSVCRPPSQLEEPSTVRPQLQVGVNTGASAALPLLHLLPNSLLVGSSEGNSRVGACRQQAGAARTGSAVCGAWQ
jgi:hypothetical protein